MFGRLKPEKAGARSIDGMKNVKPTEEAAVLDVKVLPWKTEAETQEEADDAVKQEEARKRRARIVEFFGVDEREMVTPEEIVNLDSRSLKELKRRRANELRQEVMTAEEVEVEPEKLKAVLGKMGRGEITEEDEANFLRLIPGSLTEMGAEKMFEEIMRDPRKTQIMAVVAGMNVTNWQKIDQRVVEGILTEVQEDGDDYRTPVGFRRAKEYFLKGIRPRATVAMYKKYEQSMEELMRILYGERMDYYEEFGKLKKEAVGLEKARRKQTEAEVEVLQEKKKIRTLSAAQGAEILGRAVIDGDAWRRRGVEEFLRIHHLAEANLAPKFEVEVRGVKIGLSEIFLVGNGDAVVMAYVPGERGVMVRSYYRDAIDGLWKYLPDYLRLSERENRYLEGFAVESVILPLEVQEVLAKIERKTRVRTNLEGGREPEFFLVGTAAAYDSLQDYQMAWQQGRLRGDYYREIVDARDDLAESKQKKAPYILGIDAGRKPDFRKKMVQYEMNLADVGLVRAEGFRSQDGQYNWLFYRDAMGRAWIARVELVSPVTSMGVGRDFVVMRDFTTPLYEYTTRAGIYGDRRDTKGARQGMWRNYLSNVPLIQEYVEMKR